MGEDAGGWQEAVARLTGLCGHAEAAATLLKRHADGARLARAEQTYGFGRAENDAVVAALRTVLASGRPLKTLDDLDARFRSVVAAAEKLVAEAEAAAPREAGQKDLLAVLAGSVVLAELVSALKDLYLRHKDDDALRRQTIATQLDAARWAAFDALGPP